jgi:para-aminobenzoate synthetase component I
MPLPLVEELSPPPEPWETVRRLARLPHLLFLDSADMAAPTELNRYTFLAADPVRWIESRTDEPNPVMFGDIRKLVEHFHSQPCGVPFPGGVAGLFGYGFAHLTEKLPRPRFDEFRTPDLAIGVYDWVIGWDHVANRAWIVSTGAGGDSDAVGEAGRRLESVRQWLRGDAPRSLMRGGPIPRLDAAYDVPELPGVFSNFPVGGYQAAVRRAVEYTHAGDCFQVNLAHRLAVVGNYDGLELYERLRTRNPAPFGSYLEMDRFTLASASPERFLRVDADGRAETRPIKGTRRRLSDPAADAAAKAELLASPKDRAENVMIVDLLRNDLGKVCSYGSIDVTKVCELESYRTVHHLVSEVIGHLRPDCTAVDLLQAAFPGGSVTGAPKVRAMEIIAELEPTARGPYCGSLGYLGFDGSMDTNILIRTITLGRSWAQFPVGAGIVADSDPEQEYAETLAKAEGLLRAMKP